MAIGLCVSGVVILYNILYDQLFYKCFAVFSFLHDDEKELGTFQAFSVLLGLEIPKLSKVTLESNRKESFFFVGWP